MKKGKSEFKNKLFIKDIENISGIKAHTIRIWEQRYNFVTPHRTDTGIRYYDEDQLRLILNISILNSNGYKISKIAEMSIAEIHSKCMQFTEKSTEFDIQIQSMINSMMLFDEKEFNKIVSISILKIGIEDTMLQMVFPFMDRVGLMWLAGSIHPAHEHFISNLIRQCLHVAIDSLHYNFNPEAKKFLVFVPIGESHDISILFANYILRVRGHEVIYLGTQTPFEDLYTIFDVRKPDYIFSILTAVNNSVTIQAFINNLARYWKKTEIILSGKQVVGKVDLKIPENFHILNSPKDLFVFLDEIRDSLKFKPGIKSFSAS